MERVCGAPMTAKEYPGAAFGLSLAGGIIIILVGLAVAVVGAILTFFVAGMGGIFGLVGVFWGILIVIFANLLRTRPEQHAVWGILIIVFSLFSWVGSFGGAVLGFLLALVGGILAIIWRPSVSTQATTVMQPPPSTTTPGATVGTAGGSDFCPNCGAAVEPESKFCRACGKPL